MSTRAETREHAQIQAHIHIHIQVPRLFIRILAHDVREKSLGRYRCTDADTDSDTDANTSTHANTDTRQ